MEQRLGKPPLVKFIKTHKQKMMKGAKQTQTQKAKCFKHQTRKHKISKSQKLSKNQAFAGTSVLMGTLTSKWGEMTTE